MTKGASLFGTFLNKKYLSKVKIYYIITMVINMEFDEMRFKEEIELMNLQKQMQENQIQNKQTLGFNLDSLYNSIENNEQ